MKNYENESMPQYVIFESEKTYFLEIFHTFVIFVDHNSWPLISAYAELVSIYFIYFAALCKGCDRMAYKPEFHQIFVFFGVVLKVPIS